MVITAKQGKANKIHISVDGEYTLTVSADFWYGQGLSSGSDISEEDYVAFYDAALYHRASFKAVAFLSRRDYCSGELFKKLRGEFDEKYARSAVEKAEEKGYIDDRRYAENRASALFDKKGMSASRIRSDLIFRGVDSLLAREVTEKFENEPREKIAELLQTKFANRLDSPKNIKRVFDTLVRLGYAFSDIRSAFEEIGLDTELNHL